jgi:hypothetical protein
LVIDASYKAVRSRAVASHFTGDGTVTYALTIDRISGRKRWWRSGRRRRRRRRSRRRKRRLEFYCVRLATIKHGEHQMLNSKGRDGVRGLILARL